MADQSNGEFGAFLSGFMIGGLIGAATALLMAPQSGEQTREYLTERSIELRDRADKEVQQLRDEADRVVADARAQVSDLQKTVQQTIDDGKNRVNAALNEGKKAAKDVKADLEDGVSDVGDAATG